jgi:hypothetical protein
MNFMQDIIRTFLFVLALILLLVPDFSCDDNSVTIPKEEYKKLIGDTLRPPYPKPFQLYDDKIKMSENGIVFASDGHEYLVTGKDLHSKNVGHYIDCVKCIERSKIKDSIKNK